MFVQRTIDHRKLETEKKTKNNDDIKTEKQQFKLRDRKDIRDKEDNAKRKREKESQKMKMMKLPMQRSAGASPSFKFFLVAVRLFSS